MKDIKNLREANSFIDSCYDSTIEVKDICNFCKRQEAREDYIDILRGIGIVFMIMGHIGFGFIFDKYIHAFHMPMFFIISGFFYKKKENMKISQIVVNKVKKLIVPYIVFGITQYIFWLLLNHKSPQKLEPLYNLLWINTNNIMPIAGALWFLTCLFFVDIIFLILRRYITNNKMFYSIIMLIAIIGTCFTKIFTYRLPWALDVAFTGIGLYLVGYLIKKYKNSRVISKIFNFNLPIVLIVFMLDFVIIMINGYINLRTGKYGFIPLFWINAIIMTLCLWKISMYLNDSNNKFFKSNLIYIGKNSIVYLCFNQLIILCTNILISNILILKNVPVTLLNIFILFITLIIIYFIAKIFTKTKLRVLVGMHLIR